MLKKVAILFIVLAVSAFGASTNKTTQAKQTKTTPKKTTKAKPKAKQPARKPIIPSPEVLENVAKSGVVIDFGDSNIKELAKKFVAKKDLKIHFFGDSHIAADTIPHQWRMHLGNINSIGFAFPLFPKYHQNLLISQTSQLFEIYNSRINAYPDYPLGGVVAKAKSEKANLKISSKFTPDNQKFLTQITFKSPNTLGAFVVTDSSGKTFRLAAKAPNTWEISKPMSLHFPITIQALMPNAMLGGYFIYNQNMNNFVSHSSANGVRSDVYLKWNQSILKKQLGVLQHDLIVLCYGSNDAMLNPINETAFMQNYKNFIDLLRQTNPNATILIVGPPKVVLRRKNSQEYTLAPNSDFARKAIAKLAKNEKTLYFDMFDLMEKTGGKDKWVKVGLSKQDVHLTPSGYRAVADAMYNSLEIALKDVISKDEQEGSTATKESKKEKDKKSKSKDVKTKESKESEKPSESTESKDLPKDSKEAQESSAQIKSDKAESNNVESNKDIKDSSDSNSPNLQAGKAQDSILKNPENAPAEEIWQESEATDEVEQGVQEKQVQD